MYVVCFHEMIPLAIQLRTHTGVSDLSEQHKFGHFASSINEYVVIIPQQILSFIKESFECIFSELVDKVYVKSFSTILE